MFAPVVGVIIYFSFGVNYRHKRMNSTGRALQDEFDSDYFNQELDATANLLESNATEIAQYHELVEFLRNIGGELLSENKVQLLVNGEEKFPEVLTTLESAAHFIHMEYYSWENDTRGNQIKELLLKKVKQGIKVRVLYDDYASRKIKRNIVKELKGGGVEIHPKIKVKLSHLANRLNHRDHRKVIVVDGKIGFIGGINISDRYDNSIDTGLYWRDTHVRLTGQIVHSLQRHFVVSWNASSEKKLNFSNDLFPKVDDLSGQGIPVLGQIIAGGPIYPTSNLMLTYFRIFTLASKKLYITNPYFIPNESILDSLKGAAISGVDVRIMLPKESDSALVGAASKFYFQELLDAGVRIFLYRKGFVHAKTVVADSRVSVVGTANMDIRSFDLNFEIMAVLYGRDFGQLLESTYINDLKECDEIKLEDWNKNGFLKRLMFAIARLVSSFI
jgi:cardiolipin synthase